jgi:hypothetical protein
VTSSDGVALGDSSSVEDSEEDELEACMREKKLERTGVTGVDFEDDFEGVFFEDETLFDDSVRDGLGRDGVSFSFSFSFEDERFLCFEGSDFDFGDFGGSVFDLESFGGAASGNAPICVALLVGVGFDDDAFAGAGFGAAAFGDVGFAGAAFGDVGFAGVFDADFGIDTFGGGSFTGAAVGVNCPFAICRARSLTLRNILTAQTQTNNKNYNDNGIDK